MSKILIENCRRDRRHGQRAWPGVDVVTEGNRIAAVEPTGDGSEPNGSAATLPSTAVARR